MTTTMKVLLGLWILVLVFMTGPPPKTARAATADTPGEFTEVILESR